MRDKPVQRQQILQALLEQRIADAVPDRLVTQVVPQTLRSLDRLVGEGASAEDLASGSPTRPSTTP